MANTAGTDDAPDWYEVRRYTDFRLDTLEDYAARYDSNAVMWFDQAFADRIAERTAERYG